MKTYRFEKLVDGVSESPNDIYTGLSWDQLFDVIDTRSDMRETEKSCLRELTLFNNVDITLNRSSPSTIGYKIVTET